MTASPDSNAPMLEVRNVSRTFGAKPDLAGRLAIRMGMAKQPPIVRALDEIDLSVRRGEVLGLVGESGCGKSTLGRIMADISPASGGDLYWKGHRAADMKPSERKAMGLAVQMIFQNPMAALNPRMTIENIVVQAPRVHGMVETKSSDYADQFLEMVGFDPTMKKRFPHQFSGGQRQRVNIARALAVQPEFLVCDESVAALDVSIQAQILNLFMDLRERLGLTYVFISHDLGVVEHISDRVAIMYLGRIVEQAPVEEIFRRPAHPYTLALLSGIPKIEPKKQRFEAIKGELPSPLDPPKGCHFHPRCPLAMDKCRTDVPKLGEIAPGHRAACHLLMQ